MSGGILKDSGKICEATTTTTISITARLATESQRSRVDKV
jgi:hypothetical protein